MTLDVLENSLKLNFVIWMMEITGPLWIAFLATNAELGVAGGPRATRTRELQDWWRDKRTSNEAWTGKSGSLDSSPVGGEGPSL